MTTPPVGTKGRGTPSRASSCEEVRERLNGRREEGSGAREEEVVVGVEEEGLASDCGQEGQSGSAMRLGAEPRTEKERTHHGTHLLLIQYIRQHCRLDATTRPSQPLQPSTQNPLRPLRLPASHPRRETRDIRHTPDTPLDYASTSLPRFSATKIKWYPLILLRTAFWSLERVAPTAACEAFEE